MSKNDVFSLDELTKQDFKTALSDDQREDLKRRFVLNNKPDDIREYHRQKQEESQQELSYWQRTVKSIKSVLGITEKLDHTVNLSKLKSYENSFAKSLEVFSQRVKEHEKQFEEVSAHRRDARLYFSICMEDYDAGLLRVDEVEAALEKVRKESAGAFNPELHELELQLHEAESEQNRLYNETENAMSIYICAQEHYDALSKQLQEMRALEKDFTRQLQATRIELSRAQMIQELRVNGDQPALMNLYERVSLCVADLHDSQKKLRFDDSAVDKSYSLSDRDFSSDTLVKRWLRTRE